MIWPWIGPYSTRSPSTAITPFSVRGSILNAFTRHHFNTFSHDRRLSIAHLHEQPQDARARDVVSHHDQRDCVISQPDVGVYYQVRTQMWEVHSHDGDELATNSYPLSVGRDWFIDRRKQRRSGAFRVLFTHRCFLWRWRHRSCVLWRHAQLLQCVDANINAGRALIIFRNAEAGHRDWLDSAVTSRLNTRRCFSNLTLCAANEGAGRASWDVLLDGDERNATSVLAQTWNKRFNAICTSTDCTRSCYNRSC